MIKLCLKVTNETFSTQFKYANMVVQLDHASRIRSDIDVM